MTDRIVLSNVAFYGFHGTSAHETELGQRFFMDVEMFADLSGAIKDDDIERTVNYKSVFEDIREIAQTRRYRLLESLGDYIARTILSKYSVEKVTVRIRKPSVPLNGILDHVEVEITRTSGDVDGGIQ